MAKGLTIVMAAGAVLMFPMTSHSANLPVKAKANKTFDPFVKRITKGKYVTWKAPASGPDHSVTAWAGDWNLNQALYAGNDFKLQFTKVGVYKYRCYYHGDIVNGKCVGMCGKVKVSLPQ